MTVEGLQSAPTYIPKSELFPHIWDVAIIIKKKKLNRKVKNNKNNNDSRTNHF
jgi:hypothetical protein